MRITFYGRLVEHAGTRTLIAPDDLPDVRSAIRWIAQDRPELAALLEGATVKAAVDDRLVAFATPLTPASELAFLPPVGGG